MITYERAREIWLASTTRGGAQELPEGVREELLEAIQETDRRIRESEGKEPQHSLLIAERNTLVGFHDQICGKDETLEGPVPQESDQEGGQHESMEPEERFYRISEDVAPETPAIETPIEPKPAVDEQRAEIETDPQPGSGESSPERLRIFRAARDFPCFVGPDLRTYGPFMKEDVAALSEEVLSILVSRRVGEIINLKGENP